MKRELYIELKHEVLSLVTDIAYSCVPDWYNSVFTDLKMNLIIPKCREGHRKLPAIVWICGGAYSVVSNSAWVPEMLYYARRGFVIASIEYRTSNKASFPAGIIDVKAAIRYLKSHAEEFCIDLDNIFVMGESAGATYAVLAGLTAGMDKWEKGDNLGERSDVAGVIDFYGPVDFSMISVVENDKVPSWAISAFLGDESDESKIAEASPISYVNDNAPPFAIFHGTSDETVPIMQSDALYEKLREYEVPCEYFRIKNAVHGDDVFYQDEVKELVLEFMRRVMMQRM